MGSFQYTREPYGAIIRVEHLQPWRIGMQWEVPMCFWFVQWVRKGVLIGFLLTQVSPLVVWGS